MILKRLRQTTMALLVLIGMIVFASENLNVVTEEHTSISITKEVSRFEPPTFEIQKETFEPLTIMEHIPTNGQVITQKSEIPVQKLTLIAPYVEKEENETIEVVEKENVFEETEMVEETIPSLEEGTIIDPDMDVSEIVLEEYVWDGEIINSYNGTVTGPNGKETYYNLNMSGIVKMMKNLGYDYEYWVREDGAKMYGPFIMVAANLNLRPRGSIVKTSLGWGLVCDTGGFAKNNPTQLDIAVTW